MLNRFANDELRIVTVGTSSTIRQVFTTVLKEFGYKNITGVSSLKSALEMVETSPIDWIICPLNDNDGSNVLQVLEVFNNNIELRHTKVSCYHDTSKSEVVPKCFENGLLSYHSMAVSLAEVKSEFQTLTDMLKESDGDFAHVAATYLRKYLDENGRNEESIALENAYLEAFPGNKESLLHLGETLFKLDLDDAAKKTLFQLDLIHPELIEVKQLLETYTGKSDFSDEDLKNISQLMGFKSAVIIDSDIASTTLLKKQLSIMGFTSVTAFDNPIKALKWLRKNKKTPPNLILAEWKQPEIPGPVFLYKLRQRLKCAAPLIIINEGIEDREMPMVHELGASQIVPKPVNTKTLQEKIVWTISEHLNPREPNILKYQLKQAISQKNKRKIAKLKAIIAKNKRMTEGDKDLIEAELAFDNGCFAHAKEHGMRALQNGAPAPEAMEILGRTLTKLRDFDGAIRCLKNVNFVSPLNVEHLCNIAECQLENGDQEDFEETIQKARDIDHNSKVVEIEAKSAIQNGHTETAKKLLTRLKSFKDILAYTNNRAVALIRTGEFESGINLYTQALESLPEGKVEVDALVHYNIGLAYARFNELELAIAELKKAEITKNAARRRKTLSLKKKIIDSISNGVPLVLKGSPPPGIEVEEKMMEEMDKLEKSIIKSREVTVADGCLHNIYTTKIGENEAAKLTENPINFTFRGKIKKDFRGIQAVS